MNLRYFLIFRASLFVGLALFLGSLPLWVKAADTFGLVFVITLSAVFGIRAFFDFRSARKVRAEERAFAPPVDASIHQQKHYFKTCLVLGGLGAVILTIVNVMSLNSLESGREKSVWLLGPVGDLYQSLGYWPAVLSVPVLGLLVTGALYWKIRKIDEECPKAA